MKADAGEQFVGQGFIEQSAVGVGSLSRVAANRKPRGMLRQCAARTGPDWLGNWTSDTPSGRRSGEHAPN